MDNCNCWHIGWVMDEACRDGTGRRRAVILTPEGLEILRSSLFAGWAQDSAEGKLTREERARRLGVSLLTADRILGGNGVDRVSLMLAFKSLDVSWQDSYCVHARGENESDSAGSHHDLR